jgi:hypothetical protein
MIHCIMALCKRNTHPSLLSPLILHIHDEIHWTVRKTGPRKEKDCQDLCLKQKIWKWSLSKFDFPWSTNKLTFLYCFETNWIDVHSFLLFQSHFRLGAVLKTKLLLFHMKGLYVDYENLQVWVDSFLNPNNAIARLFTEDFLS